ncbi:hypothetical protein KUD11_13945 [Roseovarius sp. LXJ103]|uniref:hypothetical protein n=1 Tax=Roseovarius carneus TaxID=2853164 RepID=UPI000D61677D|nr:hypothetical protein [Roseovarius carneus]MBZ8119745.1 hypothetical protein [Roseovarius carneus]PWE34649.1 hypothetical protein DD563_00800 [Pelagicola sp. LXJ1103]
MDYTLADACREFAQSPQALEFNDFIRVYFCTGSIEPDNETFRSYVSYANMEKDFSSVLRVGPVTL